MALFKEVKKPVIKAAPAGAEISPLRPRYSEKTPPCIANCPSGTDIRGWLTTIAQAEAYGRTTEQGLELAWQKITDCNPFPAVCGRVCPHPCESNCNRKDKDGPVAINALERFVGDFGVTRNLKLARLTEENYPEKVAVVGAGPAGLSCAYQLARRGYAVTVFEAFSKPGGMLRYGIPKYRLPREILDAEIRKILDLGVDLRCGFVVGRDLSLEQMRQDYRAVFVGIGAHKGLQLGIPGEDASNVFTGTEFLNRANSGEAVQVERKVIVIGGGELALRSAGELSTVAKQVTMVCSNGEGMGSPLSQKLQQASNVKIMKECNIIEVQGDEYARKLIVKDKAGKISEYSADGMFVEKALTPNTAMVKELVKLDEHDRIIIDCGCNTNVSGLFAAGDVTNTYAEQVLIAVGEGAKAALSAYEYLLPQL